MNSRGRHSNQAEEEGSEDERVARRKTKVIKQAESKGIKRNTRR